MCPKVLRIHVPRPEHRDDFVDVTDGLLTGHRSLFPPNEIQEQLIPEHGANEDGGRQRRAVSIVADAKEVSHPDNRFVAGLRTKPTRSGRKPQHKTPVMPERPAAGSPLPTARQLAWLLVQPITALDAAAAAVVTHVEQDETAKAVASLARRFTALVRASGVIEMANEVRDGAADLDPWITEAKACGAPAIATFASGLSGDAAVVKAALTEPWSSGQAEGQINRLKLIKRQSYGRAGLDLLQRRLVLAS
jgi:hypothetical protein